MYRVIQRDCNFWFLYDRAKNQHIKTFLCALSKNHWLVQCFLIFRYVRENIKVAVSLGHPVLLRLSFASEPDLHCRLSQSEQREDKKALPAIEAELLHQLGIAKLYPLLHCCIATLLHCYIATLLHCYIATLLHRYIATLLHCYIATLPAIEAELLHQLGIAKRVVSTAVSFNTLSLFAILSPTWLCDSTIMYVWLCVLMGELVKHTPFFRGCPYITKS